MVWVLLVLLVAVSGLALAALAHRRGEEAIAIVLVAFTAILASPASWSHHWVWVAVLLPILLNVRAADARPVTSVRRRLPVWTMMLMVWPLRRRPEDPLNANGIIWVAYRHGQPVHRLGENMYVPAALATMLLTAWWLRIDRDRLATPARSPRRRQKAAA
jgi:alpha-1,2-mannosyltransferase